MARRKKRKRSAFRGRLRAASKAFLVRPAHGRCQICGYDRHLGNLTFHHKEPKHKSFNISTMMLSYPLRELIAEASKCIVACHNCHGEIHAGLIDKGVVDDIPTLNYARYRLPTDVVKWYCKRQAKQ